MALRRASKATRFRSKPTRRVAPKPKPKPVAKPTQVRRVAKATAPPPRPSPVITLPPPRVTPTPTRVTKSTRVSSVRLPSRTVSRPTPKPKPVVRLPTPKPKPVVRTTRFTPKSPPPVAPVIVQQPTRVAKTSIIQDKKGIITTKKTVAKSPTSVQQIQKQKATQVPFIPGVPGLLGGAKTVPLAVGSIPFQENTPKGAGEQAFKLEGFKASGEGFAGGLGAVKERAKALDLSDKVLSEETVNLPSEFIEETIPGGESTSETRTFTDKDGNIVTETTKTTPGDIIVTTERGGKSVKQTIGKSEVKPDFSDPIGSLVGGASQSFLNEVIGVKNIGALATGGKQEEFFATPSGLFFDASFEAIKSAAGDIGGSLFDLGRQAAGKKEVKIGQSVSTFGIAGDKITITQKPRKEDALQILDVAGQRISRVATADPLFLAGDLAVQIPLLVVAPVKAASLAIKGIGVAGRSAKLASKGIGAIKGRGLQSASGQIVTAPRPKTPFSSTFSDEFLAGAKIEKAQAPQKAQLKAFGALSSTEKSKLVRSQRDQFEFAVTSAQQKPAVKGLRLGETTADFAQRRRDALEVSRLPKERISPSQLDPNLQKSLKQLEAGGDPDLFKVKDVGFTSTKIGLGKGAVKRIGSDESGNVLLGGSKPRPGGPDVGFFGVGPTGGARTTSAFGRTGIDLGGGIGKVADDPLRGVSGFSGTSLSLGSGVAKKTVKVTKAQIDKLSKSAKISKERAKTVLRETGEAGLDTKEARVVREASGLALIQKTVTKQSKALKELNEAKVALKKTKSTQKTVSSVADQKTQRKLSNLIKVEKNKAKTAGKSLSAEKATQVALRKLITAEKAKIGSRAISKSDDILFAKPRKLKGKATEEIFTTVRTPRGKQAGILGGLATGVAIGAGVGIGLNQETINKPTVITNPNIFDKEISRVVNDPTVQITRTLQQPKTTTKLQPGLVNIFREKQQPRIAISTIFNQDLTQKQATNDIFTTQTQKQQPIQQLITTTTFPPTTGGPPGFFPFGPEGRRKEEAVDSKSQRRFFRLFDVAKTPFGKIEVGLGAQVQSDKPIFEFEDVPLRSGKKRKNIGESLFSEDFSNPFV